MQPIVKDQNGVLRFKENKIVDDMLEFSSQHGFDLNKIACKGYSKEDQQQLAQLIGYSVSGYCGLSYVDDAAYVAAQAAVKGVDERDAIISELQETINELRMALRGPIARLYNMHPDDLFEDESE
jgi:hypothetical protein